MGLLPPVGPVESGILMAKTPATDEFNSFSAGGYTRWRVREPVVLNSCSLFIFSIYFWVEGFRVQRNALDDEFPRLADLRKHPWSFGRVSTCEDCIGTGPPRTRT